MFDILVFLFPAHRPRIASAINVDSTTPTTEKSSGIWICSTSAVSAAVGGGAAATSASAFSRVRGRGTVKFLCWWRCHRRQDFGAIGCTATGKQAPFLEDVFLGKEWGGSVGRQIGGTMRRCR